MMRIKKSLLATIIIVIILILSGIGYLALNRDKAGYEKIDNDTKEKIIEIIDKSKGKGQGLDTDNCLVSWTAKAYDDQNELMDKVLGTLHVYGESKSGKPKDYIRATFNNGSMRIYIAYNEKAPYKKIIVEIGGHYYAAAATKKEVNAVIDYMLKQDVLNRLA